MNGEQRKSSFSVLQGDGALYFSRIISRESSVGGQSSRIYHRPAEGVPFKWEMQPGTPKNRPEKEELDLPPLSPPPLLQNKFLPLPKSCPDDQSKKVHTKLFSFFKRIKITDKSCSSSSSTLSSSRNHASAESSSSSSSYGSLGRVSLDGPFCCSPWNLTAIMEEGNRRVYYCGDHKTAFAMENDGSFLSKIIFSRVSSCSSSVDPTSSFRFYNNQESDGTGIPFQWEMQPGRSIQQQEEQEVIPPPSPPPALQFSVVPPLTGRPGARNQTLTTKTGSRTLFRKWIKSKKLRKKTTLLPAASVISSTGRFGVGEISFKFENDNDQDHGEEESLPSGDRNSVSRSSSSSLNSKEQLNLSTRLIGRDLFSGHSCFNFNPWNQN